MQEGREKEKRNHAPAEILKNPAALVGNVAAKPSSVTVVSSAGGSASCIP